MGPVSREILWKRRPRCWKTGGLQFVIRRPVALLTFIRCWEPEVLKQMSSHYETQKALSPELIEKIIKSRYVNVGLFYLRQLFFAKFDLKVHTDQGTYI